MQAIRRILFSSSDPCLSHRDADVKLKDEQTLLVPFDDHMTTAHGSHVSVTHRGEREKCISLLMLPPVFFSTASRTEKQSAKEKRTLSICQIKTVDKKANHEFPDKIVLGVVGWGGEGSFAYKSIY